MYIFISLSDLGYLTLYDPRGGGTFKPPLKIVAPTHLTLWLDYYALETFLKKIDLHHVLQNFFNWDQGLALRESQHF